MSPLTDTTGRVIAGITQCDGLTGNGLTTIHYADGESVELMSMDEAAAWAQRLKTAGHEAYALCLKGRCLVQVWRDRRERFDLETPGEITAWMEGNTVAVTHIRMPTRLFGFSHADAFCGARIREIRTVSSDLDFAAERAGGAVLSPLCPDCARLYGLFGRDQGDERDEVPA